MLKIKTKMENKTILKARLKAITLARTEQKHPNYDAVVAQAAEYLANITGKGLENYLKNFTPREDKEMFEQRKNLTCAINPAVANSLMKPFYKVSRNESAAKKYDFKNERLNEKVELMLNDFNGDTIDNTAGFDMWLRTRFVELSFGDPNGFVVIEWGAVGASETIRPRPFEVSSAEALNYEYRGAELQWLFVKNSIKFFKLSAGKTTAETGAKFTLYDKGVTVVLEQVDMAYRNENGLELGAGQEILEINKNNFLLTIYETKIGFVPAFRVGYIRDLSTSGDTFVNPFEPAMCFFRKSLKATSELDITMAAHAFPQKLQYIQPCEGVSPTETCFNGKNPQGGTCAACNGTGFKTITTAQQAIYLKMPETKDDLIPLDDILVYKSPPIDLVKFQNDYVSQLKQEAHLAVYNSNMFAVSEAQFAKTATEIDSNMEGIYDALEPFTEKYSKIWRLVVYTCAVLAGFPETSNDFDLFHKFPSDPKLKTMSILLADLKRVNDSGAPSFSRDVINNDIAEIIFSGDDAGLLQYRVRHKFFPFNGKTTEEITMQLASQFVSDDAKVLYSNFEAIFTEIELKDDKFYLKPYKEQKAIVDETVAEWVAKVVKSSEPFAINFGSVGGVDAGNTENNSGSNSGNNNAGTQTAGNDQNSAPNIGSGINTQTTT